jgi:hypothetical protein
VIKLETKLITVAETLTHDNIIGKPALQYGGDEWVLREEAKRKHKHLRPLLGILLSEIQEHNLEQNEWWKRDNNIKGSGTLM